MAAPHPRIVYAPPPKRRRVAKAGPSRQQVLAIVGPEPQPLEPDAETLARADKADALFRELVRHAHANKANSATPTSTETSGIMPVSFPATARPLPHRSPG
jgi:hypothetical protein